jgi:hypothetical protein
MYSPKPRSYAEGTWGYWTGAEREKGRSRYRECVCKDPGPMVQAPAVGRRWDTAGYVATYLTPPTVDPKGNTKH